VLRWDTEAARAPEVSVVRGSSAAQPDLAPLRAGGFAFLDGYLFDRAEMGGRPGDTDTELVAAAWERWGVDLFTKLRGAFTIAVWDATARTLVVGRDAAGVVPCFHRWDGRRLLVASSIDAILGEPEVPARFNRLVLAEYLHDLSSPLQSHETFYEDVRRLLPAHTLTLEDGRLGIARYWDPVPPGFSWARPEEALQFEPLLRQAVARCLVAGADSIALSGGFDSVGIAALADMERGDRAPLHAVSLRFSEPGCDESETQVAVARALGMPQTLRDGTQMLGERTLVEAALDLSRTSPSPVLSPWQAMYVALLRSAAPFGLQKLIMGTGGDDVLNVDVTWGADCLEALDVAALWRYHRSWQRAAPGAALEVARIVLWDGAIETAARRRARALLDVVWPAGSRWERRRRLRRSMPGWLVPGPSGLGPALLDRHLDAPRVPLAAGEGAYVARLRALPLNPQLLLELDQEDAWTALAGVRLMLPFFDRDLLDIVLRMHPESLIAGGYPKSPLRRVVAERLSVAMPRRKVDLSRTFHALFRPDGARIWSRMGGGRRLADLGIVGPAALDEMMARYFTGGADALGMRAWLVLSAEIWLRARTGDQWCWHPQEGAS
jgi:asparagine synthase (glutamine-hydrolysing)